jgi:hypothetical protein
VSLPLVDQLRFARSELVRCLEGVTPEDGVRRVLPMNCLSWVVGHLANQEATYWVFLGQSQKLYADLNRLVGYGRPAVTPPLDEMWAVWQDVTAHADVFLDSLTADQLTTFFLRDGKPLRENIGTMLYRNIYHYWFHIGEAQGIRQALGHTNLPDFVGDMEKFMFRSE